MQFLKANTAVDVLIGPFLDSTDGNTTEDALTLSQADIKLSKNGQALTQKTDATAAAFDDDGYYNCELDATDTGTEGTLVLIVHESGALAVRHEFMVLSEAAYDSLFVAKDTGFMDVNVKAISEDETAANNLETACDGGSYNVGGGSVVAASVTGAAGSVTGAVGSVTAGVTLAAGAITDASLAGNMEIVFETDFATNYNVTRNAWVTNFTDVLGTYNAQTGDSFARIGANGAGLTDLATAASIAALNDISAADVNAQCDAAIETYHLDHLLAVDYDPASKPGVATALLNELVENDAGVSRYTVNALENAPSGTGASAATIADAVWDEVVAGHTGIGTFGGQCSTDIDAILGDTSELQSDWEDDGRLDVILDARSTQASVNTIDGIVDNIQIDTNSIESDTQDIQSRLPAALVTGRMASDAVAVSGSTAAADGVEANIGNLDAPVSTVDTVVDAILVDTAEIGAAGAGLTAINLPNQTMNITGSLSGSVGSVAGAVTGAVGSVAGNVDGNVTGTVGELAVQAKADVNAECDTAITDNFTSLDEINKGAKGVLTGACSGTPTTTSVATTDLTDVTADAYKDGWLVMTSGNAAGDRKQITASSEAGGTTTLTVDALSQAPVATDTFIIV